MAILKEGRCVVERTEWWSGPSVRRILPEHDASGRVTQTYEIEQLNGVIREVRRTQMSYDRSGKIVRSVRYWIRPGGEPVKKQTRTWERTSSVISFKVVNSTHDPLTGQALAPPKVVRTRRTEFGVLGKPVLEREEQVVSMSTRTYTSTSYSEWIYGPTGEEIWRVSLPDMRTSYPVLPANREEFQASERHKVLLEWLQGGPSTNQVKRSFLTAPVGAGIGILYVRRDVQGRVVEKAGPGWRVRVEYDERNAARMFRTTLRQHAHDPPDHTTEVRVEPGTREHTCLVSVCPKEARKTCDVMPWEPGA